MNMPNVLFHFQELVEDSIKNPRFVFWPEKKELRNSRGIELEVGRENIKYTFLAAMYSEPRKELQGIKENLRNLRYSCHFNVLE